MTLKKRVQVLEQKTGLNKEQVIFTICYVGDTTKPTQDQEVAAITDFTDKNPNLKQTDFILLEWFGGSYKPARTRFHNEQP